MCTPMISATVVGGAAVSSPDVDGFGEVLTSTWVSPMTLTVYKPRRCLHIYMLRTLHKFILIRSITFTEQWRGTEGAEG